MLSGESGTTTMTVLASRMRPVRAQPQGEVSAPVTNESENRPGSPDGGQRLVVRRPDKLAATE